jgi:hypothetical protein
VRESSLFDFPRRIREPIILIGSGRSGTTLLAETLAAHPSVAYWGEPRPIWMHGNAYRRDHVLRAEHLTARIARYVDRRFGEFLEASGRSRFLEKTPSNCLRIDFINALYPDSKIINLIRDGLSVVRSTLEIRKKTPNKGLLSTRLQETPLSDWPAYLAMFTRTVWQTNVLRRPARYWGAQPPGWKEWLGLPPHIVAAKQWKALVRHSLQDGRTLPGDRYLELRFEGLVRDPEPVIRTVLHFTGLSCEPNFLELARRQIDPRRAQRWPTTLRAEQERECIQEMEPLLSELGYGPAAGRPADLSQAQDSSGRR